MSATQPSLSETIDAVFAACCTRYGTSYFLARWEGTKLAAVKADWMRVLDGLQHNPRAVRYALANLPVKPPMAHEFKALAASAPEPVRVGLPSPANNEAAVAKAFSMARQAINRPVDTDPLGWAKSLRDREQRGEKLSIAQREQWRAALKHREGAKA